LVPFTIITRHSTVGHKTEITDNKHTMHQTDIASSRTNTELANPGFAHNKFPWATLLLFYGIGLVRCVDWFIIGALLTPIKNELHLPDEQLGQIGAVFFVASSFTSPIFGYLAFLGQNQAASHVFILLEIFFTCLRLGPVNALLIETVPVAQRSAASAVTVICANGLSNVISADLIGAISDKANLRVGMLVAPIAFVLSGLLFLVYTLVNHRRASQEVRSFRVGRGSVRAGVAASSPALTELRPTVNLHRMEAVELPSTDRKAAVPFCNS